MQSPKIYAMRCAAWTDEEPPKLEWTDSRFRRRLSDLSKMTVEVVHNIMPIACGTKMFFMSFNGEINYQYKINKMLLTDHEIMPAPFSISVFNSAPALASIALNLKAGYTAIYPLCFKDGFLTAIAPLLCGEAEECLFVYADESIPFEYKAICNKPPEPLAFATLLSTNPVEKNRQIPSNDIAVYQDGAPVNESILKSPQDFLKALT
ncbi:MAG: hypothetical protein Ta2F_05000 [Termitinemataceae bacterium]|nr:MAG: hypothetical protein Ta2F_05000 [Termitinemataceae bacterium]